MFGVCSFTWLPVFIDAAIAGVFAVVMSTDGDIASQVTGIGILGVSVFAFYKYFFSLAISPWWILASPVVVLILAIFPGGFTIANVLLNNAGLMAMPLWGFIIGAVIDIIYLVIIVMIIVSSIRDRR